MLDNNLSVEMMIEKNLIASTAVFLTLLEIDVIDPDTRSMVETIRVAKNTEPVTYRGNLYGLADFELDIKHARGELPSVRLSMQDHSQAIQNLMQRYGGGVGFGIRMLIVNSEMLNEEPEIIETYTVVDASAENYVTSWSLGIVDPGQLRFPRRTQRRDICQWRYKSTECGYTGALLDCDLTLQGDNGCAHHQNERNFSGYPGLSKGRR